MHATTTISPTVHRELQLSRIEKIASQFPFQSEGPRIELIQHLSNIAGSPDKTLANNYSPQGFNLIGDQPVTGLWRAKVDAAPQDRHLLEIKLKEILLQHKSERSRGHYRLPARSQRPILLNQLRKEAERGWWHPEKSVQEM